ncbi:MAG: TonB-dependent receptor, partial [Ferruginibacter sp.]
MHKLTALVLFIAVLSVKAFSQNITVTGLVKDTTEKKMVKNAVVALLTVKDSILYKFTRTDAEGKFVIKNVKPSKYIFMTTHPYFADLLDDIDIKDEPTQLGTVSLTSKSKLMQEVIVKSGSPIKIKGDTTIYTADSFKVSANANVEELLKKLPGIQVDKNGTIKAMGETVEKVLVDGEEFFGDDPGMAIKNLRADAVKEVQVFDKKSDQAEFTGIDDGKTKKTINLKLKDDKKKGYFGKIEAAGGPQNTIDDRFNTNTLLSSFKGKRKFSAFLLNGNTGQDGMSWRDSEKFGGESDNMSMSMDDDGGMMMTRWRGGSSDDEPYVNTENGFITNVNAGIQYSNKWNDKQTLNISPKYNSQIYTNGEKGFTQTQIGDSILNDNASTTTNVNRRNFKTSISYEAKIDTNNSFKITAKANFYTTASEEERISTSMGKFGTLKNSSNRVLQSNSDKQALSGNALFKHRFSKARRTLSFSTDWNMINSQGTNYLQSQNQSYMNGLPAFNQVLNQMKDNNKSTQNVSSKIVFTEPLSKKYSLELTHEITYNFGNNDQITYTFNPISKGYDVLIDSLSNRFNQSIMVNRPSIKINYASKKIKYNFGSGFGLTHFDLIDKSFNKDYIRN